MHVKAYSKVQSDKQLTIFGACELVHTVTANQDTYMYICSHIAKEMAMLICTGCRERH